MPDTDKPALQELTAPRSVDELQRYWPDKPKYFLVEGDIARLPAFIRSQELSSFDALARVYRGSAGFVNAAKSSAMMPADSKSALKLFQMGLTVFFDDIAHCVPGATEFLRQLERDLGINAGGARLTAFASPCDNGLAPHYDCNDVVSIQLLGTKQFGLAPLAELPYPYGRHYTPGVAALPDTYPQMTQGFPDWRGARFETIEMKRGSVLFYPRGTWHQTRASAADSFSLSIIIEPPAPVDCVIEQLRLLMLQDARWRKPLYGAWGDGPSRESAFAQAAELLREIPTIASAITPKDLVRSTLGQERQLASIDQDSRFQRVPLAAVAFDNSTEPADSALEWVRVTMKDEHATEHTLGRVEVPRQYREVVSWLGAQAAPFSASLLASRFPAIPFEDHKKLLEICTQVGLLKMLSFPALPGEARH
jgi:hypothetical protein